MEGVLQHEEERKDIMKTKTILEFEEKNKDTMVEVTISSTGDDIDNLLVKIFMHVVDDSNQPRTDIEICKKLNNFKEIEEGTTKRLLNSEEIQKFSNYLADDIMNKLIDRHPIGSDLFNNLQDVIESFSKRLGAMSEEQ